MDVSADGMNETLLDWSNTVRKQITTDSTKSSTGIDGKWVEMVSIMLQQEQTFREDLEKTFSKKIADLVRKCDRIAVTIQLTKKQPVPVIIDDLDKLELSKVPAIFRDEAGKTDELSEHLLTQAMLKELQAEQEETF